MCTVIIFSSCLCHHNILYTCQYILPIIVCIGSSIDLHSVCWGCICSNWSSCFVIWYLYTCVVAYIYIRNDSSKCTFMYILMQFSITRKCKSHLSKIKIYSKPIYKWVTVWVYTCQSVPLKSCWLFYITFKWDFLSISFFFFFLLIWSFF